MRILIVCSGNYKNFDFKVNQVFIYEQINEISKQFGIEYDTFFIKGKGVFGYLRSLIYYRGFLRKRNYDLIHAHFGLSGFLAVMQSVNPVIITFHNGEILRFYANLLSSIGSLLANYNIYVASHIRKRLYFKSNKYDIIPCGVDLTTSVPYDKASARRKLNLEDGSFILFGGSFKNRRKNYKLLNNAQSLLSEPEKVHVIELKDFSRTEVTFLFNACDVLVLPSLSEGSPQVIKEAMACNCPIVSTDVGDVRWILGNTEGCFLCTYDPADIAQKIQMALEFSRTKGRTNGRQRIIDLGLDSGSIALRIVEIYKKMVAPH
jgi:teichuronic acid biosynthesis glycosyltransferase TuaC